MSLFSGLRERYDKAHPPAPRPTHLEADTLTKAIVENPVIGLHLEGNQITPEMTKPPVQDSSPTFDAAHPYQLDGLWWTADAASAKANADQKARALAAAKEADSTPVLIPSKGPIVGGIPASSIITPGPSKPFEAPATPIIATQETPMAAAPVPAPKPQSGFVTFFKKLGQDLAKILPAVDAVEKAPAVQALESLAFGPAITNLIATWIDRATVVEAATAAAVGTAAASSGTSSLQKASIVINSMTPVAQQLATQLGASQLTVADMEIVNNAVIAIANVYKVPAPTA